MAVHSAGPHGKGRQGGAADTTPHEELAAPWADILDRSAPNSVPMTGHRLSAAGDLPDAKPTEGNCLARAYVPTDAVSA